VDYVSTVQESINFYVSTVQESINFLIALGSLIGVLGIIIGFISRDKDK